MADLQEAPAGLSVEDAAAYIGVGQTLMWDLVLKGEVKSVKIGRRRIIRRDTLDRVLAEGVRA